MTANLTEAVDFLWEHFRETAGGVEITAIKDGHVESRLVERDGVDWNDEHLATVLSEMLTLNIDGYAIYYGVSTTTSARGGGRGGEHAVIGVPCYWADVDFRHVCPDMEPHRQEEYVYELLMNYLPERPPSAIIHSGGGMQAMWTFWRPIPLDMYLNKPHQLKAVNQGIQQHVESDAVHNADRLLRLPGFVNHKYEHKPVAYVVKPYGDEPYTYFDFDKYRVAEPPPVHRVELPRDERLSIPDWIQDYLTTPPPQGERNATLYRIAATLKDYGWMENDVHHMLDGFAGLPEREAQRTISSAYKKAPRGVTPSVLPRHRKRGME